MAPPEQTADVRLLVIGAGSRGNAYAKAVFDGRLGVIAAVAEPDDFKRNDFGAKFIWRAGTPQAGQAFRDWREFVSWKQAGNNEPALDIDGVFVCTQDETHYEIVMALVPLGVHIMCEKPLTTNLKQTVEIYKVLVQYPETVFGIGHVLRYSPHNLTLRKLLVEDRVIGDIISVEHTEPVGFWHFAHSYVRFVWAGSSRKLLTDIEETGTRKMKARHRY
jgi:predicted dehydrogenase